jgi:hypothetical protein
MLTLHMRCVEGFDPPPNNNVVNAFYCQLSVGRQKFRTRTLVGLCLPRWRQDFRFTVSDFVSDSVLVSFFNPNILGLKFGLCSVDILVRNLVPGVVLDHWFDCQVHTSSNGHPRVHLVLHLASNEDKPFVGRPFPLHLAHFRVISLLSETEIDPTGYVVALSLLPTRERRETDGLDKYCGVHWEQEFHFILNGVDRGSLKIELISKKTVIGEATLPLTDLTGDRPKKGNYRLTGGNSIRLCSHLAPHTVESFFNEEPEEFPQMSKWSSTFA